MHYVYVIQSKTTGVRYTGSTGNLRKRFAEHQQGKSSWTRNRGPWRLVYYEACLCDADAWTREKYLPSGMGKRYINNRIKRFLPLTG